MRLACGPNRTGKTTAGCTEDISFALGFRPWLVPIELLEIYGLRALLKEENWRIPKEARTTLLPPVKVLVIEDDWETADEILFSGAEDRAGKLTYYMPADAIQSIGKNALGYNCEIALVNGSLIRVDTEKSFVNDPNSFEGGTNDLIHYDEGKKRPLRVALKRGLADRYGYEIFTLTPLCEPWIFHEVYKKAATNRDYSVHPLQAAKHISKEGWLAFLDTLTEDERLARGEGQWVFLKGLVYPEFVPKDAKDGGHLTSALTPEWLASNATVYVAIDPHPRQPLTALFLAVDNKGRLILFDEVFKKCLIEEFCELIRSKLKYITRDKEGDKVENELPVARYLIDPIAYVDDPVSGLTWADEFIFNDIPVEPSSKAKAQGICNVRQEFKDNNLFITTNCIETLREIQLYVYDEWKDGDRNSKEKTIDKDDHMMECMYRLVVSKPEYVDPKAYEASIEPFDLAPI